MPLNQPLLAHVFIMPIIHYEDYLHSVFLLRRWVSDSTRFIRRQKCTDRKNLILAEVRLTIQI